MKIDTFTKVILVLISVALIVNLISIFTTSRLSFANNETPPTLLSAGDKGVVYFYDGVNLWCSKDYGSTWIKIK